MKGAVLAESTSATNHRRANILLVVFGLCVFLPFAIVFVLLGGGSIGIVLAAVIAAIWSGVAWFKATDVVLDLTDAETADEHRHARLFNTTAGLCTAMGVAPPALYVVEDPGINLLVAGMNEHDASLVITQGAYDVLSILEFEAVVAFGLHRIKSRAITAETVVVPTFGACLVLGEVVENIGWLNRALMSPAALVARVVSWTHPARSDLAADLDSVSYTRSPPALASALEKMNGHSALAIAPDITAHLWLAPPLGTAASVALASLHTTLDERIDVLREL